MRDLDIGEVRDRTGVSAATLRYYEERGLATASGRKGLRRQYDPSVLSRLALIALGQRAGFSLEEIAETFGEGDSFTLDRERLRDKVDELDRTIARLGALRDAMQHVVDCPAETHSQCPTFQRLMRAALARRDRG